MSTRDWGSAKTLVAYVPDHVVFRDMAQETVLLNMQTGRYHGIDAIGARFFELLRSGRPLEALAPALAAEYEQSVDAIEGDLFAFSTQLEGLGLIELRAA